MNIAKPARESLNGIPKTVPIIEETIGYNLNGGVGAVEAQREYEVDMGKGLKKRYKIRVPLVV